MHSNTENDKLLSLKLIGFKVSDTEKFSAILDLAEFGLKPAWQIVDTSTADFYLLTEKPKTNNYRGLPREQCFFYGTDASNNADKTLYVDTDKTPRLHALIQLLNRLATQVAPPVTPPAKNNQANTSTNLNQPATTQAPKATPKTTPKVAQTPSSKDSQPPKLAITPTSYTLTTQTKANETLNQMITQVLQPEPNALAAKNSQQPKPTNATPRNENPSTQTLPIQEKRLALNPKYGLLKPLLEATSPFVFTLQTQPDYSPIYINPEQNVFYCASPLELLTPYFTRDNGVLATSLSVEELNITLKKHTLSPYPLRNLIWYTAFKCSRGKLIQGLSTEDIILLTHLPYVGPDSRSYINLAASLKKKAATLEDATKETGVTLELAIDFYNACHLAGLIEKKIAIEQHQKAPELEKQSLLTKLKNRLKN
jgi:hypothetical protein